MYYLLAILRTVLRKFLLALVVMILKALGLMLLKASNMNRRGLMYLVPLSIKRAYGASGPPALTRYPTPTLALLTLMLFLSCPVLSLNDCVAAAFRLIAVATDLVAGSIKSRGNLRLSLLRDLAVLR